MKATTRRLYYSILTTIPVDNVACVRRCGENSTSNLNVNIYVSGKYRETRNSCRLSMENGMGIVT